MEKVVTVQCPLCHDAVEIPEYDRITRTDALAGHFVTAHLSQLRPASPKEGPPLPRGRGIKWPGKK